MRLLSTLALLAGCSSSSGAPDAAVGIVLIHPEPDLVGFPTKLTATLQPAPAGPLTYRWSFVSMPAATRLDDRVFSDAASVSFEPDAGGEWKVMLEVDGVGSALTSFTVPTAPIFFLEGRAAPEQKALGVIRSDGSGRRLVSCPTVGAGALGSLRFEALYGMRSFEPPSAPARHVFLEIVLTQSGMPSQFRLWAADESSDCMSQPPRRIDSVGLFNDHAHFWPRFSPDGNRVMYVDQPQDTTQASYRIVTVNFDDTQEFIVRARMLTLVGAAPIWLDATHVAWVENLATSGPPHLVVFQASDGNSQGDPGGDVSVLLDCGSLWTALNQFERAGDALLVAASTGGPTELWRVPIGQCLRAQKLAAVPSRNLAADFVVTPDGATVIFASSGPTPAADGGTTTLDLWRVPADGSQPAAFFLGEPGYDDYGPRLIAGGRQVVWTQLLDGKTRSGAGLLIANLDGTHLRALAGEDPDGGVIVAGGSSLGTSCSFAPTGGSPWLVIFVMAFRRRRRPPPADRPASADSRTRC